MAERAHAQPYEPDLDNTSGGSVMISLERAAPSSDTIESIYKKNMRWGLYGSMLFEGIMLVHRIMLFCTMSLPAYGVVVSMLSLIHLGAHLADWGATNSIPPLLSYFTRSKQHFKIMMLYYTLAPHLPLLLFTTGIMLFFLRTHAMIIAMPYKLTIFVFLVSIESVRNFVRQFLYTVPETKAVVSIELSLLVGRIVALWGAYGLFHQPLTPFFILFSHVIEMLVCMLLFVGLLYRVYRTLPHDETFFYSDKMLNLCWIKFFNYILRLSRNLFTANFLTPLLAVQCGLATAGVFYLASKLAHALLSVVKITIGYTGNGLLAAAKKRQPDDAVPMVFMMLSRKLFCISVPLIAIFVVLAPIVSHFFYAEQLSYQIFMLCFLFLLMSVVESAFILYECLYILHHAAAKLFLIKMVELAFYYCFMYVFIATSPYLLLMSTVVLRAIMLAIVVWRAYLLLESCSFSLKIDSRSRCL